MDLGLVIFKTFKMDFFILRFGRDYCPEPLNIFIAHWAKQTSWVFEERENQKGYAGAAVSVKIIYSNFLKWQVFGLGLNDI